MALRPTEKFNQHLLTTGQRAQHWGILAAGPGPRGGKEQIQSKQVMASECGLCSDMTCFPGPKWVPGTREVFREELRLRKTLVVFGFGSSHEGI